MSTPESAYIIIPARYASSRFPGKPLARIAGKSLIERVHERASAVRGVDAVFVATDDERIASHVREFTDRVVMTSPELASGTDRIAAALTIIERSRPAGGLIINVQGDEPLLDVAAVERLIEVLRETSCDIATLACPLREAAEYTNPDVVKVVTTVDGDALYFSRAPIPSGGQSIARRHVGVYGYRRESLERFCRLSPSRLELAERLEQLRALENGFKIRVVPTAAPHAGVDRPEDVAIVEAQLQSS